MAAVTVAAEAATMAVASAAQGAISAAAAEEAAARAASAPAGVGTGTKQSEPSAEQQVLRLNFIRIFGNSFFLVVIP
jgi:hypothetical protein